MKISDLIKKALKHDEDVERIDEQLDTKAKQIDLEIERKRIDSFTKLAEGSTTGDAELIDGRVGADGTTYTNIGSAIREQFSNVHDLYGYLPNIIGFEKINNIDITKGGGKYHSKYINFVKGYIYKITVEKQQDVWLHYATVINGVTKYTGLYNATNKFELLITEGMTDFYFNNQGATDQNVTITVEFAGMKDKIDDIELRLTSVEESLSQNKYKIVKTVKKDGTGDFSNLRSVTDYIKNNPHINGYEIHLYEGEYDVLADYTTEEINNASYTETGFVGVELTNNNAIKGVGSKEKIIIKGELDKDKFTEQIRLQISTLNLKGNSIIENVTVTSKFLRYAIHDDFSSNINAEHKIKKCDIINYLATNGVSRGIAYGLGTRSGTKIIFENCHIEPSLGYHNNTRFSSADNVKLINTRVYNEIGVSDTNSGVIGKLEMINSACEYIKHTVSSTPSIKIIGIGISDFVIISPNNCIYETGNTVRKLYTTGVKVGSCVKRRSESVQTLNRVAISNDNTLFLGICLYVDTDDCVVQKSGYIGVNHLGDTNVTSWEVGSLLKCGSSGYLEITENRNEAVAIVELNYNNEFYIKLI